MTEKKISASVTNTQISSNVIYYRGVLHSLEEKKNLLCFSKLTS